MTKKKIWFGNAEKMMWVNCPSTNIRRGRGKWEETGGYLNGGAYAVSSPYSHRKYSIDWNLMESAEAAKIMSFYEGVYGQSPIQFVDPFAAKSNILPLHWSVPRLCAGGEAPTIGASAPTLVNAPNDQGYPGQSAVFNLTGSSTPSAQIPVPPGKNLYVGARGSATGTAAVSVTTPGGAPVLGRNLATNPSFEATSGTVEVRRNLASDPRATTSGTVAGQARWGPRWAGLGGTVTTVAISGPASDGPWVFSGTHIPTFLRKTWTVSGGVSQTGFDHTVGAYSNAGVSTTGLPVTAGETYTFSSYMRASVVPTGSTATTFTMGVTFRDGLGARILPVPEFVRVTPVAGQWVRVALTAAAPAGAATVSIGTDVLGTGTWPVGATLDGTGLLVEASSGLGAYFDGSTSPDSDLTPTWTGTANASASVLNGVGVAGVTAVDLGQGVQYRTADAPVAGSSALRTMLRTTGVIGLPIIGFLPTTGTTYTMLLRARARTRATTVTPRIRGAAGTPVTLPVGVWTEIRLTVAAGSGTLPQTGLLIASGSGHQPSDLIDVDCTALVEGVYTGPWFDGSNPPAGYESLWEGAANASTSIYRQRTTVDLRPVTETAQTTMVLNDPGTVTLKLSGTGALTLNSMTAVIGTAPPTYTGFRQGEGNTGLRFAGEPNRTGYSSVLDLESVSAEFVEVGAWE